MNASGTHNIYLLNDYNRSFSSMFATSNSSQEFVTLAAKWKLQKNALLSFYNMLCFSCLIHHFTHDNCVGIKTGKKRDGMESICSFCRNIYLMVTQTKQVYVRNYC